MLFIGGIMPTGSCLRIYLSESDTIDHSPVLEALLKLCQQAGLQGVSVLRGIEGLGKHGIHTASFVELTSSLPLVVEIIDSKEKIDHALPLLKEHLPSALMATWPVQLIQQTAE